MNGELFRLSLQSIQRKRRSSLLLFAVLLLSFAFAIISLTVTGSMQKTNEEYRFDVYGTWYGAIFDGREEDEDFLQKQEWLDTLGIARNYGRIQAQTSCGTGIGVMDEAFMKLGRIGLQDGRFPEAEKEIAMEADLLSALGYDYTLGQEITVTVNLPAQADLWYEEEEIREVQMTTVSVQKTYVLSGVLKEYADLWIREDSTLTPPLNSALIVPGAAKEIWQSALESADVLRDSMNEMIQAAQKEAEEAGEEYKVHEVTAVTLDKIVPQYYFTVLPDCEGEMKAKVDPYLAESRGVNPSQISVYINTVAFSGEEEVIRNFYVWLVLAVTLLAVICIYAIQIQDEARQLAIFRSIGITKRQLCVMLLYETLCLGVPAMALGTGVGVFGTWALLQLAVYSGSTPIQLVVPPLLLAATAALWLLGVLIARLIVFLVALRAPLTGRFTMARKKAKRYRNLQRVLIAGLSALLCTTVVFTAVESLEPIWGLFKFGATADYAVTHVDNPYPTAYSMTWGGESPNYWEDMTVPTDVAPPIERIPGVKHAWGWGMEWVRLEFDGMENVPFARGYKERLRERFDRWNDPGKFPHGTGPFDADAMVVELAVVDEGDWEGIVDFDVVDLEKFRSGEEVIMAFCLGPHGKFTPDNDFTIAASGGEYEETGLAEGDAVRVTIGSLETYGTAEAKVGGILAYRPREDRGSLLALYDSYSILCSAAFVEKLMDSLGPGATWNEFRQGTPYAYEQISVFTDRTADFLSTDTVLAEYCVRMGVHLDADARAVNQLWNQRYTQRLLLLLPGGFCVALVLLLILWNTLSMEAERQKRNIGIKQALGMSRRQVNRQQFRTAALRSLLGALVSWLAYSGYCLVDTLRNYRIRQLNGGYPFTVRELLDQKISIITRYWGDWQVVLPLTAVCVILILAVSWFAKRRLMKEDLMAKLRDEH